MPRSKTTHGHGSQLWLKIGAGEWTRVAQIDDIPQLPSFETELYETSNFDTEGVKEQKKLPLKDGVPITIRGNYQINSDADGLLRQAEAEPDVVGVRIVLSEGADVYHDEFDALVYNYKRSNPKDAKRTFEIMVKPQTVDTVEEPA